MNLHIFSSGFALSRVITPPFELLTQGVPDPEHKAKWEGGMKQHNLVAGKKIYNLSPLD